MCREATRTTETSEPILRRPDGSIDTDFYEDRARRLRNDRVLGTLLAIRNLRRGSWLRGTPPGRAPAKP